ncbi:MAG TPA: family 43 glycosylhydrolase [Tepidisphaeraceae bacterium]|jgi:beta-xylosidase|nr:family 43 glycosylhydrolase [Tepidisphaeraceae bacterium]
MRMINGISRWWLGFVLLLAGVAQAGDTYQNPLDVIIADPFVLRTKDAYYLYGTTVASFGLQVFSSTNLIDWRGHGFVLHRTGNSWAQNRYWAPECFEYRGKYYLHYTASSLKSTMRICLAVADTPLGPFTDVKTPWLDPGQAVIDSDVFRDTDGKLYLYYVLDCSENGYSEIRVCALGDDLTPAKKSAFCLKPSQKWEGKTWNEGPFVMKHNGTYYMTYSANVYAEPSYGLGYATAVSPMGPWTKSETNPILQKRPGVAGPGHNAVTTSPDGKELFVVYHTLQNPGFNTARQLAVDRMHFEKAPRGGPDRMVMDGPTATPQPFPSGAALEIRGKSDEFSGTELNRKVWTVFNEDAQTYALKAGHLLIRTMDGDVAEKRDDAENIFLQYAPLGDFTATTHVTIDPRMNYQNAFLCVWQDHDNFVKLATVYSDKPRLEVAIESAAKYDSHLFDNTLGTDVYLRITKRSDRYSFAASRDNIHWMTMMADVQPALTDLRVGIGAASPGTNRSTTASFDFIHFTTP